MNWKVYKVVFSKPIQNLLVIDFDFLKMNHKLKDDLETIFLLCKEAIVKSSLDEFYTQKQATNKYMIGNLLFEEGVLNAIRKEVNEVYPDIKVTNEEIKTVLLKDVLKRDVTEGEEAEDCKKKIHKANKKIEKLKAEKSNNNTKEVITQNDNS